MSAVSIMLDIPTRSLRTPYTYVVPASMEDQIALGCMVRVEFGTRDALGWVVAIGLEPEAGLKPVLEVLTAPLFDDVSIRLATWIADEYCSSLAEALRLLIPPGSLPKAVGGAGSGTPWRIDGPSVTSRVERWAELAPDSDFQPRANAHRQRALLDSLKLGPCRISDLRASLGPIDSALRRLADEGALVVTAHRRFRAASGALKDAPRHERLTAAQTQALDAIVCAKPGEVLLMDGVTGSGKTEVYMRAVERLRVRGESAIILVPEISLTPQTVGRFRTRFGNQIAVLHSRLSSGERYDEWDRIRCGDATVVVGARSALFAPVRNLGLIVIDEEHSSSYKQGQSPRYDARDVARKIAEYRACPLVLGSATPRIESLSLARSGEITRLVMQERVGDAVLPSVQVVDMGLEFNDGNRSIFSLTLQDALRENLDAGRRALLLLNRRGFASFLLCRECGHVPTCDSCSTSLTYHQASGGVLACHHCGSRRAVPPLCPVCGSPYLRQFGAGTQRVEHELHELFPDVAVVRMDADTTKGKAGHERILARFEAVPGSILVGTQMVAKGLDYPDVGVVGVLSADITLHLPDFRSAERTYQLLAQVSGRAGRSADRGRVVIQSYWPDHPAILAAASHDRTVFLTGELSTRAELRYPPYARIANVLFAGEEHDAVRTAAKAVASRLSGEHHLNVIGPSPAPIARVKRRHRWHLLVKEKPGASLGPLVCSALATYKPPRGVTIGVDVDPVDML